MNTYWVSYRLSEETVGGRTYEDRYNALVERITENSQTWWGQTTSFYVFTSALSIDALAARLKAAIKPSHDLFLVRQLDARAARIRGRNEDQDIFKLIPYLEVIS